MYPENERGGVGVRRMEEGESGGQCQGSEGTRRTEPVIVMGGGGKSESKKWALLGSVEGSFQNVVMGNLQGFPSALLSILQCSACGCRQKEGRWLPVVQEVDAFASKVLIDPRGKGV